MNLLHKFIMQTILFLLNVNSKIIYYEKKVSQNSNVALHFNASNLYNIKFNNQTIKSNHYNKCPEIRSKYINVKYIKSNNNIIVLIEKIKIINAGNSIERIDEFNFDKHW